MKYKIGDKVLLKEDIEMPTCVLKKGTIVEITFRDKLFRTYDILYNGVEFTDFDETDFLSTELT
jgi:hypothetical protein